MNTDTQLMNEFAISSRLLTHLSLEGSKAQKALLLEMYKDIATLCENHGLEYMMDGGTSISNLCP